MNVDMFYAEQNGGQDAFDNVIIEDDSLQTSSNSNVSYVASNHMASSPFPGDSAPFDSFLDTQTQSRLFTQANKQPLGHNNQQEQLVFESFQSPLLSRRTNSATETPTRAALSQQLANVTVATKPTPSKRKRTSSVWEYFTDRPGEIAQCKKCSAEISRVKGQTSGMKNHLKTHNIILDTEESEVAGKNK